MSDSNGPLETSEFFFTDPTTGGCTNPEFSGQTFLLAWEHAAIANTVNALLGSYGSTPIAPAWPVNDYDTIWTVALDGLGNLTVSNATCEGIHSATLPATAPQF
jgi:hypothetical protein